tara:strand:- start:252 stop:638 length:387 start_codon:yes stop_codon:yes gene_type:complete
MLLSIPSVLGCSTNKIGRQMISSEAQTAMLGMSRMQLLRRAGAPQFLEKDEQSGFETMTFVGGSYTGYSISQVNSTYKPILISGRSRNCNVVVNLEDDKVVSVDYKGNGSLLAPHELCAQVVETCLQD